MLGTEILTLSDDAREYYSVFTLALLEDTGWYLPDYDLADKMEFGAGNGCPFTENQCSNIQQQAESYKRDFCHFENEKECSNDGNRKKGC